MDKPLCWALSLLVSRAVSLFILWSIVATVLRVAHNFHLHPLSRFPGPPGASCTKLWLAFMEVRMGIDLGDLRFQPHKDYGDIGRIAPNEVRTPFTPSAEVQNSTVMSQASFFELVCTRKFTISVISGTKTITYILRNRSRLFLWEPSKSRGQAAKGFFFSKAAAVKMQHLVQERLDIFDSSATL